METKISTTRIIIRLILGFIVTLAILLGSAGVFNWVEAWVYVILQYTFSIYLTVWLKKNNPELLKERMIFLKSSAKGWDKVIVILASIGFVPLLVMPGLDAVRFEWSYLSPTFRIAGFGGIFIGFIITAKVMKENAYLYRIVEVQKEQEHKVSTTGPYHYIRHPMYAGVILWVLGIPLAFGSLWTFVPAIFISLMLVIRIGLEEKSREDELDGYLDYQQKVKYRLIPGVW